MKSSIRKQAERFLREQKNYKRWLAVFLCLAVMVTIGTTAALKYKGIAVTTDNGEVEVHTDANGVSLHVHTEECYEEQLVLVCERVKAEESEDTDKAPETGETEQMPDTEETEQTSGSTGTVDTEQGHVHDDSCYEITGGEEILTCSTEEHSHGDDCYETKTVPETVTKTVTEEITDEDGNVIDTVAKTVEETVEKEEKVLTCSIEEHSHGASCYETEGGENTLVCGQEEGEAKESTGVEAAAVSAEAETAESLGAEDAGAQNTDTAAESTGAEDAGTENAEAESAGTRDTETESAGGENTDTENAGTEETDIAEETAGEHVHDDSCYELQMVLICGKVEGEPEEDVSGNDLTGEPVIQECEDEEGTVKVIAAYGPEAELPENAELRVKRIKEDDADFGKYEEEFKEELEDEEAEVGLLLDIGFYVDGEEVEPAGPVSIMIQMLDESINVEEKTDVVHFGKETESFKDVAVEEDYDGSKTATFEANSFSPYALRGLVTHTYTKFAPTREEDLVGKSFVITYVGGENSEIGNGILLDSAYESGYTKQIKADDFPGGDSFEVNKKVIEWTFNKDENGFYITSPEGKYLNMDSDVELSYDKHYVGVDIENGKIKIKKDKWDVEGDPGYLVYADRGEKYFYIDAYMFQCNDLTLYTKSNIDMPEEFTINYYKNAGSVNTYRDADTDYDKSEQPIGTIKIRPTVNEKGEIVVSVPLTGKTDEGTEIGDLPNLEGGPIFYGWSDHRSSNYQSEKQYLIYCGKESFEFEGKTIPNPTYAGDTLLLNAEELSSDTIDLYAIWAVPVENSSYGHEVDFYVRLDGEKPSEPAHYESEFYTEGVLGKNASNPLKLWMHIYGTDKEEIINAVLRYEPSAEQIYSAIINATNKWDPEKGEYKKIYIGGEDVTQEIKALKDADEFSNNYYVSWYVSKDHAGEWHIDGVLMKKSMWSLIYDGNGITNTDTVIMGKQYNYNAPATVHNTRRGDEQVDDLPKRTGYTFTEWTTEKNGGGESFTAGDTITVDAAGKVYKNNTLIEDITAKKDAHGQWQVTLYAQWEKNTHDYIIKKAWADENSMINPLITSVEVEITRYATISGQKVADSDFQKICTLESSKGWKAEGIELEDTDDDGNPYTYVMRETSIKDDSGEMGGAVESFILDYTKENKLYTLTNTLEQNKIVKLSVKKTAEKDNSPLAGAEFKLVKIEEGRREVVIGDDFTSEEDGMAIDEGALIAGTYALQEVKAPTGYLLNDARVNFEIKESGTGGSKQMVLTVKGILPEGWEYNDDEKTFTLKDKSAEMSVKVKKVSDEKITGEGSGLNGAEFVVTNSEGKYLKVVDGIVGWGSEAEAKIIITGEGKNPLGMADIPALPAGTYHLKETKAPDGHILQEKEITFTIEIDTVKGGLALKWNGSEVFPNVYNQFEHPDTTITVINSAGVVLPETGGPGTAAYTFGGLAMIAVGLMYGLSMRRKREKGGLN